jgi:hypothetical protein
MIVAASLCPAPPLLVRVLTGAQLVAEDLRTACLDSVAEIVAAAPDVIVIIGAAERTGTWDGASSFDVASFAPGLRNGDVSRGAVSVAPTGDLPPPLGVGTWLLDRANQARHPGKAGQASQAGKAGQAGWQPERVLQMVAHDEPPGRCAEIGAGLANLAGAAGRVALLVMADGSARRGLRAPGYLDERSVAFDAGVEQAVRSGRLEGLLAIDPALAADLMATGRPAWQVLAGALAGRKVSSEVRYCDDPFGVAYLVASFRIRQQP